MVDIINRLEEYNISPIVVDPWAYEEFKTEYRIELTSIGEVNNADVVLLTVDYKKFNDLSLEEINYLIKRDLDNNKKFRRLFK